jgi:hypothetical protein
MFKIKIKYRLFIIGYLKLSFNDQYSQEDGMSLERKHNLRIYGNL